MAINSLIKSDAFDITHPKLIRQGNSSEVNQLVKDLIKGDISGLITVGVNPVYNLSEGVKLGEAIKKLDFSASFCI